MIAIDNTVLSNFARTNHLGLLERFCRNRGLIPRAVRQEFQAGVQRGLFVAADLSWSQNVEIVSPQERHLAQTFGLEVGSGESECLAIAICRNYELLTDDLRARQLGFREKIRVSGSIGVLGSLVRRNILVLGEGNQILTEFIDNGYFSPLDALDEIV